MPKTYFFSLLEIQHFRERQNQIKIEIFPKLIIGFAAIFEISNWVW